MDRDLARHVAHVALASTTRLDSAIYALEKHCPPDELAVYRQAIGNVTACVDREILDKIYADYPDLRDEIEARIAKYGPRI
jgi:hypothetical protein